jgi:nucleoid DNA-binding protein
MKEVIERVATEYNLTKKLGKEVVESVIQGIVDRIESGERLRIAGLGSFVVKNKPARMARNPKTGEAVSVSAKQVIKFTQSKDFFK